MKTIDELVDELAVRLNSGQTVKQKNVAKPVSASKPTEVKPEVKKECKKQCKCGGDCKHESPEKMTIAMAKELAEAVEKAATILGVKVVVAIRDEGANLVLLHAMDDSYIASVQASQDKAYTAVALKMPTHIALDESRGGSLDGLTNGNGILLLGGGYPLRTGKKIYGGIGVFDTMEEAIAACNKAYTTFRHYNKEQRENIIKEIRRLTHEEAEPMAKLAVEDTKMGNVYHKILKHHLVADKTLGTSDLETRALSGDRGLTLIEMAPFGIIGAITPSTNPSCTVICNSICMLAGGNGVIFNPHPHAKRISAYAVDLVNRAILAAGGPENIVCTVKEPTRETSAKMVNDPSVRMLVATGGPGVVKMLLSSGKKAIGAGAGNPPVVVDDTADIPKAAKDIIDGCTFDNNLPCIAEKECFVMKNVADVLIQNMLKNGAYLINAAQVKQLEDVVLVWSKPKKEGEQPKRVINKDWVGRDAKKILAQIGINVGDDIRCIICETEFSQAFVQTELMMPILPIVRVDTFDEAVEMAVKAEHGNRHSAHLHSKNVDHMTQYAKAICTTIFVKNAPSYAGIGFNAEGWTTFTIAGPTGEGITSPRSFTRQRRCVLSDALNII